MSKNLHICRLDKFIPPFLTFIRAEFKKEDNVFYILGDRIKFPYDSDFYTKQHRNILSYFSLIKSMYSADKIILHGLFSFSLCLILACNPLLLKKCYWVIWGGDLYTFMFPKKDLKYRLKEVLRGFVIKRLGFLLTYIKGDVDLARQHYQANGKHIETIEYLSNVIEKPFYNEQLNKSNEINILLGNSADPTNNHFEILDKLLDLKNENIKIYVPLSYGNQNYAKKIIEYGESLFGDKFVGLTEFMDYSEYIDFLSNIHIAIFNHQRQQAMGNTINLLAMGKKVYLRAGTAQKFFFNNLGVKTFDIDDFDLSVVNVSSKENSQILELYFSKSNFTKQWKKILED